GCGSPPAAGRWNRRGLRSAAGGAAGGSSSCVTLPKVGEVLPSIGRRWQYRREPGSLLDENAALLLREAEIGHRRRVRLESRSIGLIGGQAVERDQSMCNVVGTFVRHEVTDQVAATCRDDGQPV